MDVDFVLQLHLSALEVLALLEVAFVVQRLELLPRAIHSRNHVYAIAFVALKGIWQA